MCVNVDGRSDELTGEKGNAFLSENFYKIRKNRCISCRFAV